MSMTPEPDETVQPAFEGPQPLRLEWPCESGRQR